MTIPRTLAALADDLVAKAEIRLGPCSDAHRFVLGNAVVKLLADHLRRVATDDLNKLSQAKPPMPAGAAQPIND